MITADLNALKITMKSRTIIDVSHADLGIEDYYHITSKKIISEVLRDMLGSGQIVKTCFLSTCDALGSMKIR